MLLLDYKFSLSKYNVNNTTFVGLEEKRFYELYTVLFVGLGISVTQLRFVCNLQEPFYQVCV